MYKIDGEYVYPDHGFGAGLAAPIFAIIGSNGTDKIVYWDSNDYNFTDALNLAIDEFGGAASPPETPINVITSISGSDINVSWDASAGATSYDVYSSNNPYGGFALLGNLLGTSFALPADQAKLFYYIVAKN